MQLNLAMINKIWKYPNFEGDIVQQGTSGAYMYIIVNDAVMHMRAPDNRGVTKP